MKIKIGKYSVDIHSNIDVITNSSTEIFTRATDGTLNAIKDIVKDLDPSIDFDKEFFVDFRWDEWRLEDERKESISDDIEDKYGNKPEWDLVCKEYEAMSSVNGAFDKDELKTNANEKADYEDGDIELYIAPRSDKAEKIVYLVWKIISFAESYEGDAYYG